MIVNNVIPESSLIVPVAEISSGSSFSLDEGSNHTTVKRVACGSISFFSVFFGCLYGAQQDPLDSVGFALIASGPGALILPEIVHLVGTTGALARQGILLLAERVKSSSRARVYLPELKAEENTEDRTLSGISSSSSA